MNVEEGMRLERDRLLGLQTEGFELAEDCFAVVDHQGCVCVRTNLYSTPLRVGTRCRVRLLPTEVEIFHEGQCVARHTRCYSVRQQVLNLEHYLDVLLRKPGALAGSKPLAQWRAEGKWTFAYDRFWHELQQRHGAAAGTRAMVEVLRLGRQFGYKRLSAAVSSALELGTVDAAAVRYLLSAPGLPSEAPPPLAEADVRCRDYYTRPLPQLNEYDLLLQVKRQSVQAEVGA